MSLWGNKEVKFLAGTIGTGPTEGATGVGATGVTVTGASGALFLANVSNGDVLNTLPVTPTATGSSAASTIVVNSATGIVVGQCVTGTNIGIGAKVVSISGTTITLSVANTAAVSTTVAFSFKKIVNKVNSNTSLTLDSSAYIVTGSTGFFISQKPKNIQTQSESDTVFGVDVTETAVNRKVAHAGWVKVTTGTGGRAGRVLRETLVAMGVTANVMGDSEDTAFPDS